MTTILEALKNAQYNFETSKRLAPAFDIAMDQLSNAIRALESGASPDDDIQDYIADDD